MKFLIFGAGQIGPMYHNYFLERGYSSTLTKADITKKNAIKKEAKRVKPSVIINAAAKTNLEWVGENKLEALNVNVLGADNLAEVCEKEGIYFLHLSSGCIFESVSPRDSKKEDGLRI